MRSARHPRGGRRRVRSPVGSPPSCAWSRTPSAWYAHRARCRCPENPLRSACPPSSSHSTDCPPTSSGGPDPVSDADRDAEIENRVCPPGAWRAATGVSTCSPCTRSSGATPGPSTRSSRARQVPRAALGFGDVLKSRGVPAERFAPLTRISKEHLLTDQVRHAFARLDAEEVLAATHNFLAFCDVCGIDSRTLAALRAGLQAWDGNRSPLERSAELRRVRDELVAAHAGQTGRLLERLGSYERERGPGRRAGTEGRGARRGGAAGEGARRLESGARRRPQPGTERREDGARAPAEGAGGLPGPGAVPRTPRALHPLHPHAPGLRAQPHAPHARAAGRARRDPAGTRFPSSGAARARARPSYCCTPSTGRGRSGTPSWVSACPRAWPCSPTPPRW